SPRATPGPAKAGHYLFVSLLQRKRVQRVAGADDDVLTAVDEKGLRAIAGVDAEARVPQRFAGRRIVGDEVAAAVVPEQQSAGGAQQTHRAARAAGGP